MWNMSRSFKIYLDDGLGQKVVFAVKPNSEDLGGLSEELFVHKPELRNKPLKFYYEDADGDKIAIANATDFALFLEQNINKIFVETNELNVWKSLNPSLLNTVPDASGATKSSFADEIRSIHHEGILCDVCDKEVYGFRYKCMDCEEFDICMDCEPKQIHKEHFLLRITNPLDGEKNFELIVTEPEEDS